MTGIRVEGYIAPGFEAVAQVFADNFEQCGEQGAAFSVVHEGQLLLDVWAGSRDKACQQPWLEDTRATIFSAGKALVAVCVLQLVERGLLQLDQPVAEYWPEFSVANKAQVTVRQVLCHRSGVNAFHEPVDDQAIFDWPAIIELVAAEAPWWEPGSVQGYSPMLYGWVLGELVRRVSGASSFNDYFQAHVAAPLALDTTFGVADAELGGLADMTPNRVALPQLNSNGMAEIMRADPRGLANRAFGNPPSLLFGTNSAKWRQAQIPAANAQSSARSLAQFYGSLSAVSDERLLSQSMKPTCWTPQTQALDGVLKNDITFALGFMCFPGANSEQRFGHPGAGGALGYGDASCQLGVGYVTRAMGQAILLDHRADRLLEATYSALGLVRE
jgi:CubicO group peptidase (beta-lactamase class C family)